MSASARSSRRISRRSSARPATSRSTPTIVATKFAALAEEIARATGAAAGPAGRSPRASCASPSPTWPTRSSRSRCRRATTPPASRCNASAAPAASMPAWSPTRSAWRRCSSIPYAGVLSAYGMGLADQTVMREQAVEVPLAADDDGRSWRRWPTGWRRKRARRWRRRAPSRSASSVAHALHLRYAGTEAALIVPYGAPDAGRRRLHRGASRPLRLRHARAAAGRRGGRGRGDRRRASRCARRALPRARRRRARRRSTVSSC